MKLIVLPIAREDFFNIANGKKKADLREGSYQFHEGDLIHYINADKSEIDYCETNLFQITDVMTDTDNKGLHYAYAILSLEKVR